MKSRLGSARPLSWERSRSSAPGRVSGRRRRPRSARRRELPGRDDTGRVLEHRGPVRDRPGRPGRRLRARRTSATSSRARRPCTWASSTSRSTTRRWRSRAATSRTRPRPPRRRTRHLRRSESRPRALRHAHRAAADSSAATRAEAILDKRLRRATSAASPATGPRRSRRPSRTGSTSAQQVAAGRARAARKRRPRLQHHDCQDLDPPAGVPGAPVAGVWQPNARAGARPAPARDAGRSRSQSASQFRPDGPNALTSQEYADDFNQVKDLGRIDSASRTPEQTNEARFWTDHDIRQWNDGMLHLAARPGTRPRADRADAGDGARRRRRRDDRLLRRQVPLLVLAALPGDPAGGHRRQPARRSPTRAGSRSERRRTSPSIRRRTPATAPPSSRRSMPSSAPTRSRFTLDSRAPGDRGDAHVRPPRQHRRESNVSAGGRRLVTAASRRRSARRGACRGRSGGAASRARPGASVRSRARRGLPSACGRRACVCGRPSSETVTGSGSGAITKKRANPGPCAQSAAWLELVCRPAASGGNQPWQKIASSRRGSGNGGGAVDAPRTKVVTAPSVADRAPAVGDEPAPGHPGRVRDERVVRVEAVGGV